MAHLFRGDGRHRAYRRVGDRAVYPLRHPVRPDVGRKPCAKLGLPAGASPDGRLPRHQRNGVCHAVYRRRWPRAICWRAGALGAHHGCAGQALRRSCRSHRPAPCRRHTCHRRERAGGNPLRRDPAGLAAVDFLRTLPLRIERALRLGARHRRCRRHRRHPARGDSRLRVRTNRRRADHHHRLGHPDRPRIRPDPPTRHLTPMASPATRK